MNWVIVISFILLVISIVITTLYFCYDLPNWVFLIGLSLMLVSGTGFIVAGLFQDIRGSKTKTIEYPASEYSFEIKVIEFQGNKDTTYVLIPKGL